MVWRWARCEHRGVVCKFARRSPKAAILGMELAEGASNSVPLCWWGGHQHTSCAGSCLCGDWWSTFPVVDGLAKERGALADHALELLKCERGCVPAPGAVLWWWWLRLGASPRSWRWWSLLFLWCWWLRCWRLVLPCWPRGVVGPTLCLLCLFFVGPTPWVGLAAAVLVVAPCTFFSLVCWRVEVDPMTLGPIIPVALVVPWRLVL